LVYVFGICRVDVEFEQGKANRTRPERIRAVLNFGLP